MSEYENNKTSASNQGGKLTDEQRKALGPGETSEGGKQVQPDGDQGQTEVFCGMSTCKHLAENSICTRDKVHLIVFAAQSTELPIRCVDFEKESSGQEAEQTDQGEKDTAVDRGQGDLDQGSSNAATDSNIGGGEETNQHQLLWDRVNNVESYFLTVVSAIQDTRAQFMMLKNDIRNM